MGESVIRTDNLIRDFDTVRAVNVLLFMCALARVKRSRMLFH